MAGSDQGFLVTLPGGDSVAVPGASPDDFESTFLQNNSEVAIDSDRDHYVHTDDMDEAVDALETHGCVVLCGPPGCGKTALGHALLRRYRRQGFRPYVLTHVRDWHVHVGEGRRSVVLMDGILGEEMADRGELRQWRTILPVVNELRRSRHCLLVLTLYPHVLRELRQWDVDLDSPLLMSTVLVHVMRYPLSTAVQRLMLAAHLKELELPETALSAVVTNVLLKDTSGRAFPWCCRQLAIRLRSDCELVEADGTASQTTPVFARASDPTDVFTAPSECYVPLLQRMFSNKEHGNKLAAVAALTMLGCGRFLRDAGRAQRQLQRLGFQNISDYELEAYADVLKGLILLEDAVGFCDRDIYEAVGLALGRCFTLPILLMVCDVTFLVQHVRTKETEAEFSVTIGPTPDDRQLLLQTMYEHLVSGKVPEMCQHPALHCPHFLAQFEAFCRCQKNCLQRVLSAVDPVHKMPLLYWSVWGPSSYLTQWCLQCLNKAARNDTCLLVEAVLSFKILKYCFSDRMTHLVAPGWRELPGLGSPKKSPCTVFDLPLPAADQCVTKDLKEKRDKLMGMALSGDCSVSYLDSPLLKVSNNLVKVTSTAVDCRARLYEADDELVGVDTIHVVLASRHWHLTLRLLLEEKVDETDDEGNTLLHRGAHTGHTDVVSIAVRSGASLTATNNRGLNPTQLALCRRMREWRKAKARQKDVGDIFQACRDGDVERVKVLLCTSAGVHDVDWLGVTPLHAACETGQTDIAALLLGLDADVGSQNAWGSTPLHYACENGHTRTARLLIEHGADISVKNDVGRTPLQEAAENGHRRTVRLLLRRHHSFLSVTIDTVLSRSFRRVQSVR